MPALAPRATVGISPSDDAPPAHDFDTSTDILGDHNGLTDAQIGAMVGAILGFIIIGLTFIFCCLRYRRNRRLWRIYQQQQRRNSKRYTVTTDYSYTSSVTDVPPSPKKPAPVKTKRRSADYPPPPPKERIPGGPKFPTYRAIPIPNPRENPSVRHKY